MFRAGDVITFSGTATDAEDGTLPASAYTWNIDFLHEGHVHPGTPITGVTSGTFTIPTSGHDFSGFTRYRIMLTVTDSSGLQSSQFVTIFPDKVNLTFDTAPGGLTLYLDGIAHTAPFVYDTLMGFNHTIEARDQTVGTTSYTSPHGPTAARRHHTLVVPDAAQTYTATFNVATAPAPLAFVQANSATPQTNQTQVSVAYTSAQVAGDTNILVIGWNNATSNITSVTDTAGNIYQLAVPTVRGSGISQAIYYAKNIKSAAAGTNTVTVTFNTATAVRGHPRSGVQRPRSGQSVRCRRFRVRHQQFGEQRRGYDHCRSRTHHRSRNDDWWLLGSRQRLHHSRHHFARRRHCRRPVRDRYRELQRHRIALGVRGMGDAGRDLQGGELVWHRSGAWIATRPWETNSGGRPRWDPPTTMVPSRAP